MRQRCCQCAHGFNFVWLSITLQKQLTEVHPKSCKFKKNRVGVKFRMKTTKSRPVLHGSLEKHEKAYSRKQQLGMETLIIQNYLKYLVPYKVVQKFRSFYRLKCADDQ